MRGFSQYKITYKEYNHSKHSEDKFESGVKYRLSLIVRFLFAFLPGQVFGLAVSESRKNVFEEFWQLKNVNIKSLGKILMCIKTQNMGRIPGKAIAKTLPSPSDIKMTL